MTALVTKTQRQCQKNFAVSDWCLNVFHLFYFRYAVILCLNGFFVKNIDCKLKTLQCFQSDVCRSSSRATYSPNNQPECLWERLNPGHIRLQRTRCRSLSLLLWANANGWRLLSQHISQPLRFSSSLCFWWREVHYPAWAGCSHQAKPWQVVRHLQQRLDQQKNVHMNTRTQGLPTELWRDVQWSWRW